MKNKLAMSLLVLFVLYLVTQDASQTGEVANDFFSWVQDGLGSFRDFTEALFDSSEPVDPTGSE